MAKPLLILDIENVTHDVKRFTLQKPSGYNFIPGQATEVSIDKNGWREEKRPFTFTSRPEDNSLEFIIKIYHDHHGVTSQLDQLKAGDVLLVDEPWGTIQYNGPGIFLAGGAGITPFISIFRDLYMKNEMQDNMLIFANKSEDDIILRAELKSILKYNFVNVITQSAREIYVNPYLTYIKGFIDEEFLKRLITDLDQQFYVCGPPAFNVSMIKHLRNMGAQANSLTFEK